MIAGNHNRTDSGSAALFDGRQHLGAHRVDHPGETEETELLLQLSGLPSVGAGRVLSRSSRKDTESLVGQRFIGEENSFPVLLTQRNGLSIRQYVSTAFQNLIRSAFRELNHGSIRLFVYGRHHLPHGIEGCLTDPHILLF